MKRDNRGNRVYIRMKEQHKSYVEGVSNQLKELFKENNMEVDESESLHEIRESAENQFSTVIVMLLGLALIMAVVGGIGLMGSLSISVVERTKEIGVMRAIGARTNTMMGMFILEGILQGLLSWAIVVPFSTILGQSMAKILGETMLDATLDYQYNLEGVLIWLFIILTISTLASVLPARHASSISVRESLAYA